jgi:hypothetical protein
MTRHDRNRKRTSQSGANCFAKMKRCIFCRTFAVQLTRMRPYSMDCPSCPFLRREKSKLDPGVPRGVVCGFTTIGARRT